MAESRIIIPTYCNSYKTKSKGDIKEEGQDESKSEIRDCIIVDIK